MSEITFTRIAVPAVSTSARALPNPFEGECAELVKLVEAGTPSASSVELLSVALDSVDVRRARRNISRAMRANGYSMRFDAKEFSRETGTGAKKATETGVTITFWVGPKLKG